jgi:hypothetical protein
MSGKDQILGGTNGIYTTNFKGKCPGIETLSV